MNDTPAVLLVGAVLSGVALASFAWRVHRVDPMQPERLIGELRLAQWAAILLAGIGAVPIGFTVTAGLAAAQADAAFGIVFVGLAGLVLQREPREALLVAAGGFVAHALLDIAHRPGLLPSDIAPRWYTVGCAIDNVCLAAVCYWGRRR